jgi:hypothetical protein
MTAEIPSSNSQIPKKNQIPTTTPQKAAAHFTLSL